MKKALIIVLAVLTLFTAISCKNEPVEEPQPEVYTYDKYLDDLAVYNKSVSFYRSLTCVTRKIMKGATTTDLTNTETDLKFFEAFTGVASNDEGRILMNTEELARFCKNFGIEYPVDAVQTTSDIFELTVVTNTDTITRTENTYPTTRGTASEYYTLDFDQVDFEFKIVCSGTDLEIEDSIYVDATIMTDGNNYYHVAAESIISSIGVLKEIVYDKTFGNTFKYGTVTFVPNDVDTNILFRRSDPA